MRNCQLFLTTMVEKGKRRTQTENEKHKKKKQIWPGVGGTCL